MSEYSSAMLKAIELAKRGTGYVSPNPRVGAVILDKNGKIVGEGWHKIFGGNHAEVEAINSTKLKSFQEHTLVVTLEPCTIFGKTPPCADLIIEKKFSRVVIGTLDQNPEISGKGVQKLRDAGIEVITGVHESECLELNKAFFKFITQKKPYVTLKIAQTIDGNIAQKNGQSKWITSEESRYAVQVLRSEADAILVGKNTVLMDNPFLTVRELDLPTPKKVILDSDLTLPLDLNIFKNGDRSNTIIFCNQKAIHNRKAKTLSLAGIKIESLENEGGYLDIQEVVNVLSNKYNVTSLLVEGGSQTYSSFIKSKLVDEIHFFIAPIIIGGGLQSFGHLSFLTIAKTPKLEIIKSETIGSDLHLIAKINYRDN